MNVKFKRLRNISQVREMANAVVWASHRGVIKTTDGKNIMNMLMQLGQLMLTEQTAKKRGLIFDCGDAGTDINMNDVKAFAEATVKRKTKIESDNGAEETEVSATGGQDDIADQIHKLLNQVEQKLKGDE